MKYRVSIVLPHDTRHVWDEVYALLDPAVKQSGGRHTTNAVLEWVSLSRYQLWVAFNDEDTIVGASVSTITDYPCKTMLTWLFIGGTKIEEWCDPMYEMVEGFAVNSGCDGMEVTGRRGWVRFMKKYGWKKGYVTVDRMFDTEVGDVMPDYFNAQGEKIDLDLEDMEVRHEPV